MKASVNVFLFLLCTPTHAILTRPDFCGLSIHTSDFPDAGPFSLIEATWTVPEVMPRGPGPEDQSSYASHGVSLCCGGDCSTRLSAGFWAWRRVADDAYTAAPMVHVTPQFEPKFVAGGEMLGVSPWGYTSLARD